MNQRMSSEKESRGFMLGFFMIAAILLATFMLIADNVRRGICTKNFSLLTWNVADLTEIRIEIGPLEVLTPYPDQPQISWLNQNSALCDIACIQEDFNGDIYNGIKSAYTSHMNIKPSGLSSLYKFSALYSAYQPWQTQSCSSQWDCWKGKGFIHSIVYLPVKNAAGWTCKFPIHVYNLHADAGRNYGDVKAREQQFDQLSSYMNRNSSGYSVIVAGDFNCDNRDNMDKYILRERLINRQNLTMANNPAINTNVNGSTYDYILFRTGDPRESLQKTDAAVYATYLSDHLPVGAKFKYSANYDAFPDLVVSDILSFEYSISTETGIAYIVVKNNGPAASQVTNVIISITGVKRVNGYGQIPPLNSGQSAIVQAGMDVILNRQTNDKVRINATVNSNIGPVTIRENDELNNYLQKLVVTQFKY